MLLVNPNNKLALLQIKKETEVAHFHCKHRITWCIQSLCSSTSHNSQKPALFKWLVGSVSKRTWSYYEDWDQEKKYAYCWLDIIAYKSALFANAIQQLLN